MPNEYIEEAKADSKRTDLIISGCDFSTRIFQNSFWYDGPVLNTGTPRCDIFFSGRQEDAKQKVYGLLNIDKRKHIILYAPTFRNDKSANLHGLDFKQIKTALKHKTGTEWEVLYRFHPNIINSQQQTDDGIDVSRYPDMQELLAAAHILITDYSSCMFDMAIAHKPCVLFAPDINTYLKMERGLYFDPEILPFPIASDNNRLIRILSEFNKESYTSDINKFLKSIGSYEDGNACHKIIKYLEFNFERK